MGFCLQGNEEDELPEVMLGTCLNTLLPLCILRIITIEALYDPFVF